MNKLIILIVSILICSCQNFMNTCNIETYHLKYVVFYPNYTDTVELDINYPVEFNAYKGINRIGSTCKVYNENTKDYHFMSVYESSSPYKVLQYYKKELIKDIPNN